MSLGARTVDDALRVVRALGAHRYVAGRSHSVHALALAALEPTPGGVLHDGVLWARRAIADPGFDPEASDQAARRSTDPELLALLTAYWAPESTARDAFALLLARFGIEPIAHAPFDERFERELRPLAIDAGWELLRLAELDADLHKGAIAAFGDPVLFAAAGVREALAPEEQTAALIELPAFGPVELLSGCVPGGALKEPLVAWVSGPAEYVDYVLRGVRRAAKTDVLVDESEESHPAT